MNHIHPDIIQGLSDADLLARVTSLTARERGATVELIAHLVELEARKLHLAAGYGSLFTYCRGALLLSEHETYHRIAAARAAQRFPVILEMLAHGAVNLTTVRLLAPQLTVDNHLQVLESARGLTRRQVEELVARLDPAPDVPVSIRKLPAPKTAFAVAPPAGGSVAVSQAPSPSSVPPTATLQPDVVATATVSAPTLDVGVTATQPISAPETSIAATSLTVPPVAGGARPEVHALSPDRYKLQLTISGAMVEKLRLAQDLLRHAMPSGDEAAILERAMDLLLADLAKRKFAATERPRPSSQEARSDPQPGSDSRHVPAEVKRSVFVRDRGRCAFVSATGRRCDERALVELHHVHPYSEGGPPTVENIALRCRQHNGYEWHLRSADVRRLEEEWLCRQVAANGNRRRTVGSAVGSDPATATRPGPSRPA